MRRSAPAPRPSGRRARRPRRPGTVARSRAPPLPLRRGRSWRGCAPASRADRGRALRSRRGARRIRTAVPLSPRASAMSIAAPIQLARLLRAALVCGHLRLRGDQVELTRPVLGPGEVRGRRAVAERPRPAGTAAGASASSRRRASPLRRRPSSRFVVTPERAVGDGQVRQRKRMAGAAPQRFLRLGSTARS